MKNKDLIAKLQKLPLDTEVCIADWRKNTFHSDGDPCGDGIEPDFTVELVNEDVLIPFIALSFNNDDYIDGGEINEGSSLYSSIENTLAGRLLIKMGGQ